MTTGSDDRTDTRVFCARGHACWVALIELALAAAIVVRMVDMQAPGAVLKALGVIVFVLVTTALLIIIAEINTGVVAATDGLTVRHWPHADHIVAWNRVVGMQWRHMWWRWLAEHLCARCQPGAHGFVEIEVEDDEGHLHHETLANYVAFGGPPVTVTAMLDEISKRAGLLRVEEHLGGLLPRFEQIIWRRAEA